MDFRIADTFTDSLARLNTEEQKAAKITALDLQLNPAHPSLQFHKLEKARDKQFWSVRVNSDVRLIVHRTADSLLLCYVNHHDEAYRWAEKAQARNTPEDRCSSACGDSGNDPGSRRSKVRRSGDVEAAAVCAYSR